MTLFCAPPPPIPVSRRSFVVPFGSLRQPNEGCNHVIKGVFKSVPLSARAEPRLRPRFSHQFRMEGIRSQRGIFSMGACLGKMPHFLTFLRGGRLGRLPAAPRVTFKPWIPKSFTPSDMISSHPNVRHR